MFFLCHRSPLRSPQLPWQVSGLFGLQATLSPEISPLVTGAAVRKNTYSVLAAIGSRLNLKFVPICSQ